MNQPPGPVPVPPAGPPGAALVPARPVDLANPQEQTLFEGQPALVHSLGALLLAIFTLGLAVIYFYFKRGGTSYRITTQRIVIDRGIFSKKMEQIDLYRINDFSIDRPFGQRVLGTGNLKLVTFDKTTPMVHVDALKTDVVGLYEVLRKAVEASKQQRGVRMIDYEHG